MLFYYHRVREYIPPRSPIPPRPGGVDWALENFRQQAASIAGQLVSELRELHQAGKLSAADLGGEEGGATAGVREGSSKRRDEHEEK